jgi:hypothetical protein
MPDLGSSNQPVPMPRDFTGGSDQFSVVRVIDGHKTFHMGDEGRNAYYPNGSPVEMSDESSDSDNEY